MQVKHDYKGLGSAIAGAAGSKRLDDDEDDVERCLRSLAHGVEISTIPAGPNPLRHGYDGLILATGYAGRDRRK